MVWCHNEIVLAFDPQTLFEVPLIRQHLFQPAEVAEHYLIPIVANREVPMLFARSNVWPAPAHVAGLDLADFKITKAHWALLWTRHVLTMS